MLRWRRREQADVNVSEMGGGGDPRGCVGPCLSIRRLWRTVELTPIMSLWRQTVRECQGYTV